MLSVSKMEALTRIGFAARGIMYFLIGFIALNSGRTEDGSGALRLLDGGVGKLLLALMALGFLAYGFWRLSEAIVDSEGHGSDAKGMLVRAGGVMSALIHLGLGLFAVSLVLGQGGSDGSGGEATKEGAATALALPGGQLLLTLASIGLIATGAYQLVKAVRGDFLKHLDQRAAQRSLVAAVGRAGYAARGVVFLLVGWFFWRAAREFDASEAGAIGEALSSLPGPAKLAVAAGLLLFGLFSLVEARYRRINNPDVLARLKGMAQDAVEG